MSSAFSYSVKLSSSLFAARLSGSSVSLGRSKSQETMCVIMRMRRCAGVRST